MPLTISIFYTHAIYTDICEGNIITYEPLGSTNGSHKSLFMGFHIIGGLVISECDFYVILWDNINYRVTLSHEMVKGLNTVSKLLV